MDDVSKTGRDSVMAKIEENRKNVREMVMESYRDMEVGKGRDYREFFMEIKKRNEQTFPDRRPYSVEEPIPFVNIIKE